MKLQMAAIALVSAMLGGVFGVAVWRAVDDRDIELASMAPRWWYCIKLGDKLTSCDRDIAVCERQMSKADLPCVAAPLAWCGRHHCTATKTYCDEISPDNGRCELARP